MTDRLNHKIMNPWTIARDNVIEVDGRNYPKAIWEATKGYKEAFIKRLFPDYDYVPIPLIPRRR